MKYLCLVYGEERLIHEMTPADSRALTRDSLEYDEELERRGHLLMAQALESVHTAKTIRVRQKKTVITDGPFAETKEQLLGFVFIEAADEQEAISLAASIPLAKLGSIEVRRILELEKE